MLDVNQLSLDSLYRHLAEMGLVRRLLELARDEDLGTGLGLGDITTEIAVSPDRTATASLVARQDGIAAGLAALPDLLAVFGAEVDLTVKVSDGQRIRRGEVLAIFRGTLRGMLTVERTALNLIGRLSGIATLTEKYIDAAASANTAAACIYDTRKTTPGLRLLEKYAVRSGGGMCHRMGLFDAMLLKDNHLAGVSLDHLTSFVADAAARARAARPDLLFVEVEVDSLEQLPRVLAVPRGLVDIVLLDNMSAPQIRQAVSLRNQMAPGVELEASGGVRLETVAEIAGTGVDRISVGALTHSAVSLDVALDIGDGDAAATPLS